MDLEMLADKMRQRVLLCRNLANSTSDPDTAQALHKIADDGQKDLDRLLLNGSEPGE